MITVLICDVTNLDYKRYLPLLSRYHNDKVNVFKNVLDKKLMIGCELLLRKYLLDNEYNKVPLDIFLSGKKPYIKNCDYHFSLSHSNIYSCVAISKNNVGVDIETKRIISENFKKRYNIQECSNESSLIKWTQYESYYKLVNNNILFSGFLNLDNTNVKSFIFDNYYLSIALEKDDEIEVLEIDYSYL